MYSTQKHKMHTIVCRWGFEFFPVLCLGNWKCQIRNTNSMSLYSMHTAIRGGHVSIVKKLLTHFPESINVSRYRLGGLDSGTLLLSNNNHWYPFQRLWLQKIGPHCTSPVSMAKMRLWTYYFRFHSRRKFFKNSGKIIKFPTQNFAIFHGVHFIADWTIGSMSVHLTRINWIISIKRRCTLHACLETIISLNVCWIGE